MKISVHEKFGKRLKELRLKKYGHLSAEAFAFKSQLSRVLYSNWERGKGNITLKNIQKVTDALDISLKDFFSQGFD